MSCDCGHIPLYRPKEKEKKNQKKRNIKSRKIDKSKRKMLVSKCTITLYTFRDKKHVNLKKEKKTIPKDNRIITLLYFTYNRVSIVFYYTTFC